ncbi:hypothetical protein [Zavarzinella formosa]|uniref:hypothetical protein n=1 Tax=Zavarzinella formosa TaxID=360055 RepID=UPI0002E37589|nr:hypothetical protein [Zavarzinella formosa]
MNSHIVARIQIIESSIQEANGMLEVLVGEFVPQVSVDLRVMMAELVKEAQANLAIARRAITGED